ncbi:hypothetical protein C5167_014272, partial [Papaver somniferum]
TSDLAKFKNYKIPGCINNSILFFLFDRFLLLPQPSLALFSKQLRIPLTESSTSYLITEGQCPMATFRFNGYSLFLPPAESCIIKSIFQEKEEKLEVGVKLDILSTNWKEVGAQVELKKWES